MKSSRREKKSQVVISVLGSGLAVPMMRERGDREKGEREYERVRERERERDRQTVNLNNLSSRFSRNSENQFSGTNFRFNFSGKNFREPISLPEF